MKLKITVHGVAYEVEVEVLDPGEGFLNRPSSSLPTIQERYPRSSTSVAESGPVPRSATSPKAPVTSEKANGGEITSPIAGNVLEVKCKVGDQVKPDQILLVIEAMKMETAIAAPTAGTVKQVHVAAGDAVRENQVLVSFT